MTPEQKNQNSHKYTLVEEKGKWQSLYIDYEKPIVERVWREYGDYRIMLHRIHTCEKGKALFHPHPWPSAMSVVDGSYEMEVGFGQGLEKPPVAMTLRLPKDSVYEMLHLDSWHSVRPIWPYETSMSLMVTGKPWDREVFKSTKRLGPLEDSQKSEILKFFWEYYSKRNWIPG